VGGESGIGAESKGSAEANFEFYSNSSDFLFRFLARKNEREKTNKI